MFDEGTLTDSQGQKCNFRESVIILTSNLGSGVVKKRRMGFGMEEEENRQDACAPVEEAIRKHLRPELVNRLTRIVHFNPLGMDAAWEIVVKFVKQLNERIANRGVTVELDDGAVDLILREGFSAEYGGRNLERVMDQMVGTLIAEALLAGTVAVGHQFRFEAIDDRIRLCKVR